MAKQSLIEIEAIYQSERIRFDDVAIVQCRLAASTQAAAAGDQELFGDGSTSAIVSIKVECNPDDFSPSVTYRFFGRWTEYKNRHTGRSEQQFHAQTFVRAKPHGRQGIIAYLRQAPNIGQVRASKLWDSFNSDAVRVLREQPEVAASVLKLADEKAHEAAMWLTRESALEDCQIELIDVLGGRGFPKSIARKAVQEWGNRASEVIRFDPYRLMQFRGCGFKRCDALYIDLGLPPGRRKRQALCAWYTIASDTEGHSWYPLDFILAGLRGSISGAKLDPLSALKLAKRARAIATMRTDGPRGEIIETGGFLWIAEGKKARQEIAVAEHLAAASLEVECRELPQFPGYRIGEDGSVWSCWTNGGKQSSEWNRLSADEINGGYLRVTLRAATMEYVRVQVSHLVLEAFEGSKPSDDHVACHWDNNRQNNRSTNLRWDTRSENEEDKRRHGTHQTGSGNPAAKLTEEKVIEIRRMYAEGDHSTYALARMFEISRCVIGKIINRKLWAHV